ncbi:MAG: homocysteine S-methyltransferase family protein [Lachnospiraceae bacterium]
MPELANISFPQRVTAIHQEYIEAGARLLRTNTFASNTILLHADMNEVRTNITAAVNLAKEAVKGREDVFIAGDIGTNPI